MPIGLGDGGGLIQLDIKESAQQGMGPHGLVIGATGSGKSEFLRTLVLGLAMTHSSEQLNMVLVDFKGGATFAGMSEMPHVSAVITNLADELTLVDRMQDALSGEMVRRQELLREAGNFASIRDYEKARAAGEDLDAAALAVHRRRRVLRDAVGQAGVHRPVRRDRPPRPLARDPPAAGLAAARGGSAARARVAPVLPRRAAHLLRRGVARGARRAGRLRAARRARPGLPQARPVDADAVQGRLRLRPAGRGRTRSVRARRGRCTCRASCRSRSPRCCLHEQAAPEAPDAEPRAEADETGEQESLLDVAVERMDGPRPRGPPGVAPAARRARHARRADGRPRRPTPSSASSPRSGAALGGLVVPLGTVDRPREQRRDTLTVDLAGAGGHVAVVGGPRSGKSTLLRTLVTSLALTTRPGRVAVLRARLRRRHVRRRSPALPHVAGVGTRSEPDVVRRIVAEVEGVVDRRERYFRAHGIDSIETYRTGGARRARADDGYGDVFLVVDGWSTLRPTSTTSSWSCSSWPRGA